MEKEIIILDESSEEQNKEEQQMGFHETELDGSKKLQGGGWREAEKNEILNCIQKKLDKITDTTAISGDNSQKRQQNQKRKETITQSLNSPSQLTLDRIKKNEENRVGYEYQSYCPICIKIIKATHFVCLRCSKKYHENCYPHLCAHCLGTIFRKIIVNQENHSNSNKVVTNSQITEIPKKHFFLPPDFKNKNSQDQKSVKAPKKKGKKIKGISQKELLKITDKTSNKTKNKQTKDKGQNFKNENRSLLQFFPFPFSTSLTDDQFQEKESKGLLVKISNVSLSRDLLSRKQGDIGEDENYLATNILSIYQFVFHHPLYVRIYNHETYIMFPMPRHLLISPKYTFFKMILGTNYYKPFPIKKNSTELPKTFNLILKLWSYGHIIGKENLHNVSPAQLQEYINNPQKYILILKDLLQIYFEEIGSIDEKRQLFSKTIKKSDNYLGNEEQGYIQFSNKYNNLPQIIRILSYISSIGHLHQLLIYFWPKVLFWILSICYFRIIKNNEENRSQINPVKSQCLLSLLIKLNRYSLKDNKIVVNLNDEDKLTILQILMGYIETFDVFTKKIKDCSQEQLYLNQQIDSEIQKQQLKSSLSKCSKQLQILKQNFDKKCAEHQKLETKVSQLNEAIQKLTTQTSIVESQKNLGDLLSKVELSNREIKNFQRNIQFVENNLFLINRRNLKYREGVDTEFFSDLYDTLKTQRILCLGKDHSQNVYWYLDGHPNKIYISKDEQWREIAMTNTEKILKFLESKQSCENALKNKIEELKEMGCLAPVEYKYSCFCQKNFRNPNKAQSVEKQITDLIKQVPFWTNLCNIFTASVSKITEYLHSIGMQWATQPEKASILKRIQQLKAQAANINFKQPTFKNFQPIQNCIKLIQEFHKKITSYHPLEEELQYVKLNVSKLWPNPKIRNCFNSALGNLGKQFHGCYYDYTKRIEMSQLQPQPNSLADFSHKQSELYLLMSLLYIRICYVKEKGEQNYEKILTGINNYVNKIRVGQKQSHQEQQQEEDSAISEFMVANKRKIQMYREQSSLSLSSSSSSQSQSEYT